MANDIKKQINSIGDIKTLKEIKTICDSRIANLITEERAKSLSEKPFGFIKESFENISGDLYEDKGQKYLQRYVKYIKENEDLSKVHAFYECVRKADKNGDVIGYLNEAISLIGQPDKKNYKSGLKKLGGLFCEVYKKYEDTADKQLSSHKEELDEAMEYVLFNKKTPKNLAEYNYSLNVIKEHIEANNKEFVKSSKKNIDEVAATLIRNFNEKYSENAEELGVIKEMLKSGSKELIFEKFQKDCIEKLQEGKDKFDKDGDKESATKLSVIMEKVSCKKYNPETINTDLTNFIELGDCIE